MSLLHILTLGLLQGITEFLPISSSAHLILAPLLGEWRDQGLAFDIAVHVGTLSAVVLYFRAQLTRMTIDWLRSVSARRQVGDSRLAWAVLLGTIPVGLAGLAFKSIIENELRAAAVIAIASIGFGLLLGWADISGKRERDEHSLSWRDIAIIGCAQALALVPGTSRSGITITAGLMLGLTRHAAARFSFLLSIPVIALSGLLALYDLHRSGIGLEWNELIGGALISGVSAYLCIHYFLRLLDRIGMWPFVVYRVLLGVVIWLALV